MASDLMTPALLLATTLTFKVLGIDCPMCAPPVRKALASIPGVTNVRVDAKAKTATVDVPDDFDRAKIHDALSNAGFDAELPGEHRTDFEPLPAAVRAKLDIAPYDGVSTVLGKVTIVDYYADWCGPCTVLEQRIERFMAAHPNVALRRANVGKWDTAAARQATRLGATALPYLRMYDHHGKFVASVTGSMWDEVIGAYDKASSR